MQSAKVPPMRMLLLLISLWAGSAFADFSIVHFTVLNDGCRGCEQPYRLVLNDQDPRLDELYKLNISGVWTRIYQGSITKVTLPADVRIEHRHGPRAQAVLKEGNYSLENGLSAVGLRVQSGTKRLLLGPVGVAEFEWNDEIENAVLLAQEYDMDTDLSYYAFAVEGKRKTGTFLYIGGSYRQTHYLSESIPKKLNLSFKGGFVVVNPLNIWVQPHRGVNVPASNRLRLKEILDRKEQISKLFPQPTRSSQ